MTDVLDTTLFAASVDTQLDLQQIREQMDGLHSQLRRASDELLDAELTMRRVLRDETTPRPRPQPSAPWQPADLLPPREPAAPISAIQVPLERVEDILKDAHQRAHIVHDRLDIAAGRIGHTLREASLGGHGDPAVTAHAEALHRMLILAKPLSSQLATSIADARDTLRPVHSAYHASPERVTVELAAARQQLGAAQGASRHMDPTVEEINRAAYRAEFTAQDHLTRTPHRQENITPTTGPEPKGMPR